MLAWVLVALGGCLAIWALWRARGRGPRRRRGEPLHHGQVPVPDPDDPRAGAWAILNQPLQTQPSPWEDLAGRPALRQFRLGAAFGLGVGLTLAGILYAVLPTRPPAPPPARTPAAEVPAAPTPGAGPGGPAAPGAGPGAAGTRPAARQTASIVVAEGDLPPAVAKKLLAAGLIASERAFLDRLVERQLDTRLRPGTFSIPAGASLDAVIDALTS